MQINFDDIYIKVMNYYEKALQSVEQIEIRESVNESALSDVIPGYKAETLEFGSYNAEKYAVLFVDMRGSTKRARKFGAKKTFLTMHVFIAALLEIIKLYKGNVIDIMGDGIMVFWGGAKDRSKNFMFKSTASQNAGLCGIDLINVIDFVVNKIVKKENLGSPINIGVGIDFGKVIVSKIGINDIYDVKAFGDCINTASKYANEANKSIIVSKKIREQWPKGKNGKIKFRSIDSKIGTAFNIYKE